MTEINPVVHVDDEMQIRRSCGLSLSHASVAVQADQLVVELKAKKAPKHNRSLPFNSTPLNPLRASQ
jgi:hypothetical protein